MLRHPLATTHEGCVASCLSPKTYILNPTLPHTTQDRHTYSKHTSRIPKELSIRSSMYTFWRRIMWPCCLQDSLVLWLEGGTSPYQADAIAILHKYMNRHKPPKKTAKTFLLSGSHFPLCRMRLKERPLHSLFSVHLPGNSFYYRYAL